MNKLPTIWECAVGYAKEHYPDAGGFVARDNDCGCSFDGFPCCCMDNIGVCRVARKVVPNSPECKDCDGTMECEEWGGCFKEIEL